MWQKTGDVYRSGGTGWSEKNKASLRKRRRRCHRGQAAWQTAPAGPQRGLRALRLKVTWMDPLESMAWSVAPRGPLWEPPQDNPEDEANLLDTRGSTWQRKARWRTQFCNEEKKWRNAEGHMQRRQPAGEKLVEKGEVRHPDQPKKEKEVMEAESPERKSLYQSAIAA